MELFKRDKTTRRLSQMIDNAICGRPIENGFDESKLSALETKLAQYLAANSATKAQLAEEKAGVNSLISDISHQTKTPLANILLYTQLLSEGELPEREKACVLALEKQTEKLDFLISSLVKASRLETGLIGMTPKKDDISNIIAQVTAQALPGAQAKDIQLTAAPCAMEAVFDLKWTCEAVFNMVDNAIKYTPRGGSIEITATAYRMFCRIDIADTGAGIPEEEIPQIFSRFYRSPLVSDTEGVGIGLYLAREIIAAQGGYIKVSSTPEIGSVFSAFLPAPQ